MLYTFTDLTGGENRRIIKEQTSGPVRSLHLVRQWHQTQMSTNRCSDPLVPCWVFFSLVLRQPFFLFADRQSYSGFSKDWSPVLYCTVQTSLQIYSTSKLYLRYTKQSPYGIKVEILSWSTWNILIYAQGHNNEFKLSEISPSVYNGEKSNRCWHIQWDLCVNYLVIHVVSI
jgi:hypothetical protein